MKLKALLTLTLFFLSVHFAHCQVFASYHQTSTPFTGVGYEVWRFAPEIRVSTNVFADDISTEFVLPFKVISKEDYYVGFGAGYRTNSFSGLVVPLGFKAFPFDKKKMGFQAEVAVISDFTSSALFRGSWGIVYRFWEKDALR
ncbi:hypothetical protein ACSX1A_01445 [Pontibacter sp. MBLB2868]|uniref:hypothetical protein n=1 Tax=Pontibacter sp. MBLB2868 TaxID=3451555 RepID=UPI003F74BE45